MSPIALHRFGPSAAPDLVLVHGLTEAGTAWPDAVRRWQAAWRIHAIDLRGHGRSPRVATDQFDRLLGILVDDLLGVLRGLADRAVVVGHSLGGRVAVAAALRQPERFTCLVLEEPALDDGPIATGAWVDEQLRFLAIFDDGISSEVARMRAATRWTEEEILEWAACKPLVDRTMIAHLSLGELRRTESLDALTVPTLVLAAAGGPLAPDPDRIANPLVRIELLDGVGHCVRRDDPVTFHGLVDPFLTAHRPPRRSVTPS